MTIIAAADGSALGNPGPAGWGWYIDAERWACGGWPHGTNNMGELTAVLDLLRQTAHLDDDLRIYCDSRYVINSVTQWMPGWKAKGWRKRDGKPVLNVEIMQAIDAAMVGRNVDFVWVKGHAGHELNEQADRLANTAALAFRDGKTPDPGPGIAGADHAAVVPVEVAATEEPDDLFGGDLSGGADTAPERPAGRERSAAPGVDNASIERVVELERSLLSDEVRADRNAVSELLHPRWREIGASGRLWTRDELVAEIGPIAPATLEVVATEVLDPVTILLVWRSRSEEAGTALRSSLWRRTRGRWQQLFHQGTSLD